MLDDWCAIETTLPPDPQWVAAALTGRPGLAFLWSADGKGPSYVASDPVSEASELDPEPSLPLRQPDHSRGKWARVPRWIGVLPFEAERRRLERKSWRRKETRPDPILCAPSWYRYAAVCVVTERVTVVGERWAAEQLHLRLRKAQRLRTDLAPPREAFRIERVVRDDRQEHLARVRRGLSLIRAGDIYQVNLARRLEFDVQGSALELLRRMACQSRPAFAAALELGSEVRFVSTSPELFLRTFPDGRVETIPIKGTRPRGTDAAHDRKLMLELDADEKERAELAMVIDIERNDLGRIAEVGSVRAEPPHVVLHPGVFHRQALVHARLRSDVDRSTLLHSCLPSGSITGAPKVRAMEVIAELESSRRGAYTGAYGYISQGGDLHLAMAIRCLSVRGSKAHYSVGGGIVADSDPVRELTETEWKAVQITQLLD